MVKQAHRRSEGLWTLSMLLSGAMALTLMFGALHTSAAPRQANTRLALAVLGPHTLGVAAARRQLQGALSSLNEATPTKTPVTAQALQDPDGDRIAAPRDACPELAEDFNGINDHDGCPETLRVKGSVAPRLAAYRALPGVAQPSTARRRALPQTGARHTAGRAGAAALAQRSATRRVEVGVRRPARRGRVLTRRRISLELVRADIREVLRLLAIESGVNIVYGDDVRGQITASLRGAPLDDVFVAVLRSGGLDYEVTGARLVLVDPITRTGGR